jgi:hypothetical protein
MVYMAEGVALAVLENLVHMSRQDFPARYVRITATVGDDIAIFSEGDLRGNRSLRDFSTRGFGRCMARQPTFDRPEGPLSRRSRRMELPPQPAAFGFQQECGSPARAVSSR